MAWLGDDGDLGDVTDEAVASVGKAFGAPLEEGWYRCALVEDEAQSKSWGTGLNMQFQILDGDYKERRIFDYLCVRHTSSEEAETIARAKLKAFAIAAGAKNPDAMQDTEPFYGKPVMVKVYRAVEENEKYADPDGRKARISTFASVAQWKAEHADEPTPGIGRGGKPVQAKSPTNSPKAEPAPPDDDDIPF